LSLSGFASYNCSAIPAQHELATVLLRVVVIILLPLLLQGKADRTRSHADTLQISSINMKYLHSSLNEETHVILGSPQVFSVNSIYRTKPLFHARVVPQGRLGRTTAASLSAPPPPTRSHRSAPPEVRASARTAAARLYSSHPPSSSIVASSSISISGHAPPAAQVDAGGQIRLTHDRNYRPPTGRRLHRCW
jgi:hypothetical protein